MSLAMTGTFSKSPLAWGFEPDLQVTSAQGVTVGLSDGRHYIDWVSGLGSNLLGYAYGPVNNAVVNAIHGGGGSLSLPHRDEIEAAEALCALLAENIPYWNKCAISARFCLSGTDAVAMAVRLARGVTNRYGVLTVKGGYHGWADWTVSRSEPALGVTPTERTYIGEFEFNDPGSLYQAQAFLNQAVCRLAGGEGLEQTAAVVIEQGLTPPSAQFYNDVRQFCDDTGALFIMDEVVTGLRYGLGGVCGLHNIKPDLVCMGKGIGNGFPVAALVGKSDYMRYFAKVSPVFCSSTHWGNAVNMAAVKAVLGEWDEPKVNYIWCVGELLINALAEAGWDVIGDPPRSLVQFKSIEEQAFFISGMREEGFLMNRPNFPTFAHTEEDVDKAFEAANRVRQKYKTAMERNTLQEMVKGKLPRVLFSNR